MEEFSRLNEFQCCRFIVCALLTVDIKLIKEYINGGDHHVNVYTELYFIGSVFKYVLCVYAYDLLYKYK